LKQRELPLAKDTISNRCLKWRWLPGRDKLARRWVYSEQE